MYPPDLVDKINNLNDKLEDFSDYARVQFKSIHTDVAEVKKELNQVHSQTILTNSRVNKLETRAEALERSQEACPAKFVKDDMGALRDEMSIWLFLAKHWKVIIPALAAFIGIIIGSYSAVIALVGN